MLRYTLVRVLWLVPVLICVSFIMYALMDLAPGTIIDTMMTDEMTQEDIETLRVQFDLDKPMIYRYVKYMWGLVRGDLGTSYITKVSVWETYLSRFPNTLMLAFSGLVLGVLLAIPLGIYAAKHAGTILDNLTTAFSLIGISMPPFWVGLVLLIMFANKIRLFPAGYNGTLAGFVLPSITCGLAMASTTMRQTRSAMLEVMRQDYVRTARAKGVPERQVTAKHMLRNAWIPVITTIGMMLSHQLAGAAIIEAVYSWPGVGRLTIEAVSRRDVPLAAGCVILTTITYVIMLLLVDLTYALVDPRIKVSYAPARKKGRTAA